MAKTSGEFLREYRARQREAGVCRSGCGRPVYKAERCEDHYGREIAATKSRRAAQRAEKIANAE